MAQKIGPDATYRNWNGYGSKVSFAPGINVMEAFTILPDPQTNGGLLVAVAPDAILEVQKLFTDNGLSDFIEPIGVMKIKGEKVVEVI